MSKQVRITNQYAHHWTYAEVGWRHDPRSRWAPQACLGGRKMTLRTLVCTSRIIHTRPALRMQSRTLSGVLQGLRVTRHTTLGACATLGECFARPRGPWGMHNPWGVLCETRGVLGHAQPLGRALLEMRSQVELACTL